MTDWAKIVAMKSQLSAIALFAGGGSQRMGQDKALLPLGGETLLEHTARATAYCGVNYCGAKVYVVGRDKPENWSQPWTEFVPDDEPNLGPIGALRTILRREKTVMVIACDLPRLTNYAIRWLANKAESNLGKHGLIVVNAGQWEPLFSIYTADCLPLIEENIQARHRSLHALIKRGEFAFVNASAPVRRMLVNTNTPEEWAAFQAENTMTFEAARQIVESHFKRWDEENVTHGHQPANCLITRIWIREYGWLFEYATCDFVETADSGFVVDGAFPYFILKNGAVSTTPPRIAYSAFLADWEMLNGWPYYLDPDAEKGADFATATILRAFSRAEADEIWLEPSAEGHRFLHYLNGDLVSEKKPCHFAFGLAMWRLRHVSDMDNPEEYNDFEPRRGHIGVNDKDRSFEVNVESQYTPHGERMILRLASEADSQATG